MEAFEGARARRSVTSPLALLASSSCFASRGLCRMWRDLVWAHASNAESIRTNPSLYPSAWSLCFIGWLLMLRSVASPVAIRSEVGSVVRWQHSSKVPAPAVENATLTS